MSVGLSILAAILAAAWVDVPKTDVKSVRFPVPGLSVTRSKSGTTAYVGGPIRVDMSISGGHVRKPILRIVCLCESNGELLWMDGLWDKPKTNAQLSRSDVMSAFRAAGREGTCSEARCISAVLPEVGAAAYGVMTYGEPDANRGFFRIDRVAVAPRLLVYRYELWQNGVLAGVWESSHTRLGKYEIPDDWSVRGRYPQKFRYLKSN